MQRPPSLDVVEDTVRHEFDAHARRIDATDTRSGLLLAFAGLVVSVGADATWWPCLLVARLLATAGVVVTLTALSDLTRRDLWLDVPRLAEAVDHDPVRMRLRLLRSRTSWLTAAQRRHRLRVARLRLATRLVMAAVAITVLGATVEAVL